MKIDIRGGEIKKSVRKIKWISPHGRGGGDNSFVHFGTAYILASGVFQKNFREMRIRQTNTPDQKAAYKKRRFGRF